MWRQFCFWYIWHMLPVHLTSNCFCLTFPKAVIYYFSVCRHPFFFSSGGGTNPCAVNDSSWQLVLSPFTDPWELVRLPEFMHQKMKTVAVDNWGMFTFWTHCGVLQQAGECLLFTLLPCSEGLLVSWHGADAKWLLWVLNNAQRPKRQVAQHLLPTSLLWSRKSFVSPTPSNPYTAVTSSVTQRKQPVILSWRILVAMRTTEQL